VRVRQHRPEIALEVTYLEHEDADYGQSADASA
jgi:hypothetical protein